jgi:Sec-independent protein translocase protein TatA
VGFGTEIVFMLVLGLLVLGPKRLPAVLGYIARAKAQFERATLSFKSQLHGGLENQNRQSESAQETAGANE